MQVSMLIFKTFLIFCLTAAALADDSEITKIMKDWQVIPDVIDAGPKDILKVSYDSGTIVDKGAELTPTDVKNQPKVEWNAENDAYYTLIMTDPDAPSRAEPSYREWHHWVVANIPGNDLSQGDVLSQYVGSGPPQGTGLHRYIFLLFKQPGKLTFDENRLTNTSAEGRAKFSTKKFVKKYGLDVPVAGNFYHAQYDDYVPLLYKQLGA